MGLVYRFLTGECRGNLQTYCLQFCGNQTLRRSHCLYSWDPAEHLCFVNPCNFRTLDRFKHNWLATAADIQNELPGDFILQGEASGWHTILKDVQRCVCTWLVLYVCVQGLLEQKIPGSEYMHRLVTTRSDIRIQLRLSILNTLILHWTHYSWLLFSNFILLQISYFRLTREHESHNCLLFGLFISDYI